MPTPPPRPKPPPSVADVARLAGVSPATVSRAFNTPALLGAQTLERVQRAAQQLGYQPYGLARSLRKRRSMVLGIVMPSLRYAYYAGTLELLQSLLAAEGYTLLLSTANHDPQAELAGVRALMAQGVDGVILFGRPLHDESAPLLARRGVPHLRCWSALPGEPSVAFDHGAAMAAVVDHLVALGHRRPGAGDPLRGAGRPPAGPADGRARGAGAARPGAAGSRHRRRWRARRPGRSRRLAHAAPARRAAPRR
jgi:LacI family transcriptional regulator